MFLGVAALASGCGPAREPTYPVKGKVVFKDNGQPAAAGALIWFESTKPPAFLRSMSAIDSDGNFGGGIHQIHLRSDHSTQNRF